MLWDDVVVIASDDDEKTEEKRGSRLDSASDRYLHNSQTGVSSTSSQENEIDLTQGDDSEDDLLLVSHMPTPVIAAKPSSDCMWDEYLVPLGERLKALKNAASGENDVTKLDQAKRKALHDISDSDENIPALSSQIHNDGLSPKALSCSPDCEIMETDYFTRLSAGDVLSAEGRQGDQMQGTNPNNDTSEKMTKVRTRRTKEEREALKRSQEEERKRKALEREVARSCRLADCIKYMKVSLDKNLMEMPSSGDVLNALQQLDARTNITELPLERSVLWARKVVSLDPTSSTGTTSSEIEEEELVVVLTADQFLYLVAAERQQWMEVGTCGTLSDHLDNVGALYSGKRPTYFVLGLDKYFSQEKSRQNREHRAQVLGVPSRPGRSKNSVGYDGPSVSRNDIEAIVIGLQFSRPFNIYYMDALTQVAKWLAAFTKAIAEKPFRLEKQRRSLNFLAPGGGGARKHNDPVLVWRTQIEQFPNIGKDVAEAIVARYCSPRALAEAYRSCSNEQTAQLLLQDIIVRRGDGPLATTRRVGPKLSVRIHHFFTAQDGDAYFD